jgi:parvulin-like peptidyl-prolyl isomerase
VRSLQSFALCLCASIAAAAPQTPAPVAPVAPPVAPEWGEVAARCLEEAVAWPALDELLLARHALGEDGRSALRQLLRARLLDKLARESKLEITQAMLQARWEAIDREILASGKSRGLAGYLQDEGVDPQVFREFLRLGMVQETLARRALGIPEGREVNAEQQEMWLDQVIEQRGTHWPPPPWPDGIAARCGDVTVSAKDFTLFLRTQLPAETVREACYQILLEQRVRARMPDVSGEALAEALEAEIGRRRAEVASDERYKGLSYEQVLAAQGMALDTIQRDPSVVCAALATLWVDRSYGEEGLRKVYAEERSTFDGLHGEAREVRALFLRGVVFTNELNPRTFAQAEARLNELAEQVASPDDFTRLVAEHSEDPTTREKQGLLGWVPRGDERVPAAIREAVYSEGGRDRGSGRLVGPVRLNNGAALLWVGARRPAPGWETMRAAVHGELRRRFLEDCLRRDCVVTFLDS